MILAPYACSSERGAIDNTLPQNRRRHSDATPHRQKLGFILSRESFGFCTSYQVPDLQTANESIWITQYFRLVNVLHGQLHQNLPDARYHRV